MSAKVNTKKPKIVVIGGGTGSFVVLSGLRKHECEVTAIVNMTDNGGSSGILRDELGVLPPGDVRQCLVALSGAPEPLRALFTHRFASGGLKGHTLGNIFLAACENLTGSFEQAVGMASQILQIRGSVLPVTLGKATLCAQLGNGVSLRGEAAVTKSLLLQKYGIRKLFLEPRARINPKASAAIRSADMIVMAPGNLYSSLMPNLLVKGVAEALSASKAKKIYICNLMTRLGQTEGFAAHNFLEELERFAGRNFLNAVVYNTEVPSVRDLGHYAEEGSMVKFDPRVVQQHGGVRFAGRPLLSRKIFRPKKEDPLSGQRSLIRHDPEKLAKVLTSLL